MKLIINNIRIPIEKDGMAEYVRATAEKTDLAAEDFSVTKILSKALDLRKQEQFYYKMSLVISTGDSYPNRQKFSLYAEPIAPKNKTTEMQDRPIIVGFGPAGMFAALELIDRGLKPLIFERGKKIEERSVDVENFIKERKLNSESNIQFGEGGAGRITSYNVCYTKLLRTSIQFKFS